MRALWLLIAIASAAGTAGAGERRFPPPEFDTGYAIPSDRPLPAPRDQAAEYRDVVGLFMALSLATVLALLVRSRRWIVAVMLVFLVWFGLVRRGCICPIGAIQDVSEALLGGGYAVPLTVAAFFLIPLVFAALFGRTFCGAVCPLGAVQDLVALKPVKVPAAAEHALGLLRYVYLAAAVVLAVTGSAYLICRYDPFVGIFRLSAGATMFIVGGCMLLVSLFVGRPYCRYLCPLGAIFRLLASVSKRRVAITPEECVRCRLCADACPFGAIRAPSQPPAAKERPAGRRRLAMLLLLLPLLAAGGGFAGSLAAAPLTRMHYTVRLAECVSAEQAGQVEGTTNASDAFRKTARPLADLYRDALAKRAEFYWGGWIAGAFLGVVIGGKLISLAVHRTREDWTADPARCLACGRCFEACPVERNRRARRPPQTQVRDDE